MNLILRFAAIAAELSGLVASALFSCLIVTNLRLGKENETLIRQAKGFLILFAISTIIYLVF